MERLDLRLVEYFIAVAEELHFGRAAQRLHIAQPSLSQQIRLLETQLGVTLLERNSRNVRLTPAGTAFLREARKVLNQSRRAVQAAQAAGAAPLTVGFYGSAAIALLPQILSRYTDRNPGFEVRLRELLFGSLDDINVGNVDLAFTRLMPAQTDLEVEVLTQEPRVVALPATHRLADRAAVQFADLRDESFLTNPAIEGDGPPPRWLAEQRSKGLRGRVAAKATSVQEILALVAAGQGVCLVPEVVGHYHPRSEIRYVPVTDAEPAVVSLAWRPGTLEPQAEAFIEMARRVAASA
jgi:DNA-binding transcriptional LysR family regulator